MAYSRPPWEIEEWPSVWITRTLAELEHFEPPPEFGQLAQPRGADVEPGP
jgi:hypothetical protein